jgi:hypothetical protein
LVDEPMMHRGEVMVDGVPHIVARLGGGHGGLFTRVDELGGAPALAAAFWVAADTVWFRNGRRYPAAVINRIIELAT